MLFASVSLLYERGTNYLYFYNDEDLYAVSDEESRVRAGDIGHFIMEEGEDNQVIP